MWGKARHIWRRVSEDTPDLSKGLMLESAEVVLLPFRRCSAPLRVSGQSGAGWNTTCLLRQCGHSQPSQGICTESKIRIGSIWLWFGGHWILCLLLCWWPWSHLHRWRPTLCLMLCVFQQPSHGGTQPAPVAEPELFNWALAETLKTVDAVCGSSPHSPECANMAYGILLRGLCPWVIRMTSIQEGDLPKGMCFLNSFFNSFWGFPVGKAPPAQLSLGVLPKGGWRMVPKGLRCFLGNTGSPGAHG